jgi:hypothetical protein
VPLSYGRKKGDALGTMGPHSLSKDNFGFFDKQRDAPRAKAFRDCSFGVCSVKQYCNMEFLLPVLLLLDPRSGHG